MTMRQRRRARMRATVGRPVFPWAIDTKSPLFALPGLLMRFGDAFGLEYLGAHP
jgi:hypothetical protein